MKKLSVVVAGTGQIRDVEIQPGTTAGDILHQLNLPDYLLSRGPNEPFFACRRVGLRQGQGRREDFRLHQSRGRNRAMRVKDLGTRPAPAIPSARSSRGWCGGTAPPFPSSAAKSRTGRNAAGRGDGKTYTGSYQTPYAAFQGRIEEGTGPAHLNFYLYNPSRQIRRPQPLGVLRASRQRLVSGPHGAAAQGCQLGNYHHRTT